MERVKEKPILFSGPMIKAILEGRKTVTRRVITPQPPEWVEQMGFTFFCSNWQIAMRGTHPKHGYLERLMPLKYQVGGKLWVRETFALEVWTREFGDTPPAPADRPIRIEDHGEWGEEWLIPHYRATDPTPELCYDDADGPTCRWKPSIHMPRWASRLTLEVTNVSAERIQSITEDQAKAEGVASVGEYMLLWNKLNLGRGYSWNNNSWVWNIRFKVCP